VLVAALLAMKIFKPEFWSQMGAGTVETPLLLAD
jgi:hypothetical protein